MIVVVDASALIDNVLGVESVVRELGRHELHAPVSVDAEVTHGLRRRWIAGKISGETGVFLLELFQTMGIVRHPVQNLVARMWAIRQNISAYDAGYVALAESLNVPLLTRDGRLSRSSGHSARIEYIA
jgi:predicted nucleic acid-binding protein